MKKIISALLILTMVFSMVCVSASAAGVHVNMNFASMEVFTEQFVAGAFYTEDNLLFGYAEAKALQTKYVEVGGIFEPSTYSWLTYDATITFALADDELSESERFVNLVYPNDNPYAYGRSEGREMLSFIYDVQERCFRIALGFNNTEPTEQLLDPVYKEIPTDDGTDFVTMGISIAKGNMRCFYNNELIFNYSNPEMLIAEEIVAPFLFWQDGNFIQISNITVADQGYIFPATNTPVDSTQGTTAATTPKATSETTTRKEVVDVTDDEGNTVTDEAGNKVTEEIIITEPPVADTNPNAGVGGNSATTGDVTFIVVAAMVATLGCALIVRKVNAQ